MQYHVPDTLHDATPSNRHRVDHFLHYFDSLNPSGKPSGSTLRLSKRSGKPSGSTISNNFGNYPPAPEAVTLPTELP